jgi:signal transduction histidine kinase
MKPPFKQKHPLLRPLSIMTVSIILLFLLSYLFIVSASNKLNMDAATMKVIATQRSLSQQIVNSIAADNLEGEISGPPLDSLMNSFTQLQHDLLYGNADLDIAPLKSDLILQYHKLDVAYINFLRQLEHNILNENSRSFVSLLNVQDFYLLQLDDFTASLTGYSNKEVTDFRVKEICILFISIILVLTEVRFIFLPAIRKIEKQNNVLREISFTQSHIVRRPLTNIQSLLTLTLETKNPDPYSVQLLTLAKKEADELDAAIKNNIYKSDKGYKLNT